jgi:hypothetical protein
VGRVHAVTLDAGLRSGRQRPLELGPAAHLNIVLGYRIGEKWNIGGRLHFNTGRPYTAAMAGQTAAEALTYNRNNKRLPPFFQLDLRAERTWRFRTWNLQLIIDVLNSTYAREVLPAPSHRQLQPQPRGQERY